ncbi:MAG: T9SS type A sorting domain-containing protein, partial [Saprospiraceae bacterium]
TVYSSGIVTVDKAFTFSSANVRVQPGLSGFDVIKNFTLNQNTVVSGNAEADCNCLWRGIYVYGATTMTTDTDASIQDALYAIRAGFKNTLSIKKTLFSRNFIGIRGTDGNFFLPAFEENHFDGVGPLKGICSLEPLKTDIEAPEAYGGQSSQLITFVAYQTGRGFAGLYLANYSLNLSALPPATQNEFSDLAYGIMAYDGNITIDRNSIFSNIAAGAYFNRRTAGVLFVDRQPQGPNTFSFLGNGQAAIDFDNCVQGMQIRSEQAAAPTRVGITHTTMDGVQTGIFLDARFGGGEFFGTGTHGGFTGVKDNIIDANLGAPQLITNAGISFMDYSPGFSEVEISDNEVNLSYALGGSGSAGIAGIGLVPGSDPGPGVVEVDIHDNRVTLSNDAEVGLGLGSHPNGWIRNNSGGNATAGNGVFVLSGNSWAGIQVIAESNNNLVACNQVTALSAVTEGLLHVNRSQNGQFLRNVLDGPGNGAHFEFDCDYAEYRCNEMIDNTIGLLYDNFAVTGPQGTDSITNGNRWLGTFSVDGAVADISVILGLSEYYYRSVNNETPPSVVPTIGSMWFFPALANATADCLLDECPAPDPLAFAPAARITRLDTLVAEGLAVPSEAPYAEGREWQHWYNLWRKLSENPSLASGNTVMQDFLTGLSGSNIEALWGVQSVIRDSLVSKASFLANVQFNLDTIMQMEANILDLDSLLGLAMSPTQIALLTQQISDQDSILNVRITAQETMCGQFESQRTAAIAGLLTQLASISPIIVCETNLRRVYEIYLLTVASDLGADSSQLAELETIAMQCPLGGGLGVSMAGALHQGLTGILPNQGTCDDIEERGTQKPSKSRSSLTLYPNPNQGSFVVSIPKELTGKHTLLRILDAQGGLVKTIAVNEAHTVSLDLTSLPNGLYFLSLLGDGTIAEPLSFIIQH